MSDREVRRSISGYCLALDTISIVGWRIRQGRHEPMLTSAIAPTVSRQGVRRPMAGAESPGAASAVAECFWSFIKAH